MGFRIIMIENETTISIKLENLIIQKEDQNSGFQLMIYQL